MIFKCPGSQKFSRPQPEEIKCSFCGEKIEIWTDETKIKCPKCKKIVTRKNSPACLDWCKYAKECVGDEVYKKYLKERGNKNAK